MLTPGLHYMASGTLRLFILSLFLYEDVENRSKIIHNKLLLIATTTTKNSYPHLGGSQGNTSLFEVTVWTLSGPLGGSETARNPQLGSFGASTDPSHTSRQVLAGCSVTSAGSLTFSCTQNPPGTRAPARTSLLPRLHPRRSAALWVPCLRSQAPKS